MADPASQPPEAPDRLWVLDAAGSDDPEQCAEALAAYEETTKHG